MTWIKTDPLKQGPLLNNWYNQNITGLTPSTTYRYRSYFIVEGVEYRGVNTYTATTAAVVYDIPIVNTGTANTITETSMNISGNEITDDGSSNVIEYGILYTQSSTFGTPLKLVYSNSPISVKKVSTTSTPTIPHTFNNTLINLNQNTLTYYRAFAKNSNGIGYGDIFTQITETFIVEINFDSVVENDDYTSTATISFTNHVPDTIYSIELDYYLFALCSNDNLPYGEYFSNETRLIVTKDNFTTIAYQDSVVAEINDIEYTKTEQTSPIPKAVTINNITDINNFKIRFNYDFENTTYGSRYADGYVVIKSVTATKDGQSIQTQISSPNKYSIRASLTSV